MKKLVLIVLAFIVVLASCKKNTTSQKNPDDQLSDAQIQGLEMAGVDTVSVFGDFVFPDGTSIADWDHQSDSGYVYVLGTGPSSLSVLDKKKLFIDRMTQTGFILTRKTPRIAYVYGAKDFKNATVYPGATCQEQLHGLDCSGMIYQMGLASSLKLPAGGTADYVDTAVWNKAFKSSPSFAGLQMTDMSSLPATECQPGDIIVAPNVHMGMVVNNGSSLAVLNSLGRFSYPCSKNSDQSHGPVISKNLVNWLQNIFGTSYHVLRVSAPRILLSKVINLIPDDPNYGEAKAQLVYNGEKLVNVYSQFRTKSYNKGLFTETHSFTYNNAGLLTGSNIQYSDPAGFNAASISNSRIVSTDVTYQGGEIYRINTYLASGAIFGVYYFFYQNGHLNKIIESTYATDFAIDKNGNYEYTGATSIYDTKVSIASTLPYWQYFYTQQIFNTSTNNPSNQGIVNGIFTLLPNVNNELSNPYETYSYIYNADGAPVSSTITYNGITQTYGYEYVKP
ncbi:MAG: hypothetical protein J0H74_00650 [Chitinophagaceae bacterium]|nr:hypothetical protein [Chitinophagaceae bacterium]